MIDAEVLADSLVRIADYVADHGMEGDGPYLAARDLLMRAPPRIGGQPIRDAGRDGARGSLADRAGDDGGVLPIQGPPGAGKTYTGARMISCSRRRRAESRLTANSHKVIRNLLEDVANAAGETGVDLAVRSEAGRWEKPNSLRSACAKSNEALLERDRRRKNGRRRDRVVLGAARRGRRGRRSVHRRSRADVACECSGGFARQRGASCCSAIRSSSNSRCRAAIPKARTCPRCITFCTAQQTIQADRGLFLAETWRLHPSICAFTSELFYAGRLRARPGLSIRAFAAAAVSPGRASAIVPVPTEGNQSSSPEEADRVRDIVREILDSEATWIDKDNVEQPITLDDILIIAPYNAQVFELQERLPGMRIGTVDKFQGQEAPIVIYFDDDIERRGRAARHGVSLFAEPAQRRDLAGQVPVHSGRFAVGVRGAVPHAATDAARQCVLPLSRTRNPSLTSPRRGLRIERGQWASPSSRRSPRTRREFAIAFSPKNVIEPAPSGRGETGRRKGLKIPRPEGLRVRPPPSAPKFS